MDLIVYDNGQFKKASEMSFSIFDAAFMSGECVRVEFGVWIQGIPGLSDHLNDLQHGATILGVPFSLSQAEAKRVIQELLELNELKDARVSFLLLRQEKIWENTLKKLCSRFWILTTPRSNLSESFGKDGVELQLCKMKVHPLAFPGEGKDLFRNPILSEMHRKILDSKKFEGLVLNLEGQVIGCTQSDLFLWRQGAWHTPSLVSGAVDRVSRRIVLRLISKLGWDCFESFMTLQDIFQAEECFISNPLTGILPVTNADSHSISDGCPGAISQKLMSAYLNLAEVF